MKNYGAGELYISLSRAKLTAKGKPPTATSASDPEVALDLGMVLVAGLAAERIAAERDASLTPNPQCAEPDYELLRQELATAGVLDEISGLEGLVPKVLQANWDQIERLAEYLFEMGGADPETIIGVLKGTLQK
ncbi:hypothetical protein [Methylocystis echinoides]|uniref:hypothetical protein n=1 Tax=Methylocystis echinoides TaxID=29468 RepID=UPI003439063B